MRVETDDGQFGWGEGCPWGNTYLPAHGPGIRAGLVTLAPVLIGEDPLALDALNATMDLNLPGHPYVKSAIDMACWDILGKVAGLPLYKVLGGSHPTPVALNSSISTGTPSEMIALIEEASAAGYRVHSAKIGGTDIGLDIARMSEISAALPADEDVTFDVNRAWTPAVAVQALNSTTARGGSNSRVKHSINVGMLPPVALSPSCWMNVCTRSKIILKPGNTVLVRV